MSSNNLAFFFQNFTTSFISGQGSIDYTTAGVVPSNSIGNRVFVLTLQGTLIPNASNTYQLQLDFSKVQSSLNIDLEGPLNGQFNMKEKTENAQKYVTYDATTIRSTRQLYVTIRPPCIKKPKSFYLNIQINDASSACPSSTNQPLIYSPSYSVSYPGNYIVNLNTTIGPTAVLQNSNGVVPCEYTNVPNITSVSANDPYLLAYLNITTNNTAVVADQWVIVPVQCSSTNPNQYSFSQLLNTSSSNIPDGGVQVDVNTTNNSVVISFYGATTPIDYSSTPTMVYNNYANGPSIKKVTIGQTSSPSTRTSQYAITSLEVTPLGSTIAQTISTNIPLPLPQPSTSQSGGGLLYIPYSYISSTLGLQQVIQILGFTDGTSPYIFIYNYTYWWVPPPTISQTNPSSSVSGVTFVQTGTSFCTQLLPTPNSPGGYSYDIQLQYNNNTYNYTYDLLPFVTGSPVTYINFSTIGLPTTASGYVQVCYCFTTNVLALSLTSTNPGPVCPTCS